MVYIQCKVPKEKLKASLGKNCVFEHSYKHRSNYVNCTTYEGIVTLDDSVVSSAWLAVVENQLSGKSKRCNIGDLKLKHPSEDWELNPSFIGRATKFVNHGDNLPDIDFSVDKPSANQTGTEPKYNLRRAIKAPPKLDL